MSADQKKTDIYVACFHSQPGQDLRNASGQFEIVEKAIQSGEWPYDNGDDPSFAEPEDCLLYTSNTVPLYYENRIPELQLTNEELASDIATIIDEAELDEDQEAKVEREFAREYHLITREERLDKIAEDLVAHYTGRGVLAKAMVISIDKATTCLLYTSRCV